MKNHSESDRLVLALLDTSERIGELELAEKTRDLTLTFTRFLYSGPILEAPRVDPILAEARERGFRYCLIQSYGHLLKELWSSSVTERTDGLEILKNWLGEHEFLVRGPLLSADGEWYGLGESCLLVDLDVYERLGRPPFESPDKGETDFDLPGVAPVVDRGALLRLDPASGRASARPALPGWSWLRSSLEAGLPVHGFDREFRSASVHLAPEEGERTAWLRRFLGAGIDRFRRSDWEDGAALPAPVVDFFDHQRTLTENLRRGVFAWNLEAYTDVREPPASFEKPMRALYSVCAGFKPNFILETHGFHARTKVLFFDYSSQGLLFRRRLRERWDGEDYPAFLRRLLVEMPPGETWYCGLEGDSPQTLDWPAIERRWQQELDVWGGPRAFRAHWRRYRELPHDFVSMNLLGDHGPLLTKLVDQPGSAIWWSNAFFSFYSNWFRSGSERRQIFRRWIEALAEKAPSLFLYGSSCDNVSINFVQAQSYWQWWSKKGGSDLEPGKFLRHELRF